MTQPTLPSTPFANCATVRLLPFLDVITSPPSCNTKKVKPSLHSSDQVRLGYARMQSPGAVTVELVL